MEKKGYKSVILFSFLLIGLIGIQVYFLRNTYKLKRQEILADVKKSLSSMGDSLEMYEDRIFDDDKAVQQYLLLEQGKISEADLVALYAENARRINPFITALVDRIFVPKGIQVALMKEHLNLQDVEAHRTLIQKPILIFKTERNLQEKRLLSHTSWESSNSRFSSYTNNSDVKLDQSNYKYRMLRNLYFDVTNLDILVYKDLFALIVTSVGIITAVLILFYQTTRNRLRQRKEIQVLQDIMDNIGHELRTPIATLGFASKSLAKKYEPAVLQVIDRQVDRLAAIVRPLSLTDPRDTSAARLTAEALQNFLSDFQCTHPDLRLQTALSFVDAALDKNDIESILSNLLSNSVKYGATEVRVCCMEQQHALRIRVEDNGMGMDKKEYPYIFEKYYRIQHNNIYHTKGLGLGLFIVKNIVDKYGGEIAVHSRIQEGTTFTLQLPYGV